MLVDMPKFTKQLPATPCTDEMRQAIESIARAEHVPMAQIQRRAFALFLSVYERKTLKIDSKTVELEVKVER